MKAPSSDTPVSASPLNPGETLRVARERQGLTLSGVSLQLNLPERSLAQIEAGDFSRLPGHTFARGYVRAYSKLLGLDQSQMVQEFDRYTGTNAKGSEVHSLGHIEEPVRLSSIGLRLLSLILLLLLAAVVFFWWQEGNMGTRVSQVATTLGHVEVEGADGTVQIHPLDDNDDAPSQSNASSTSGVVALPLGSKAAPLVGQGLAATGHGAAPASPANKPIAGGPAAAGTNASEAAQQGVAGAATAPAQTVVEVPPGQGRLEMRFTTNSWTRVIDADGRVLLNALMKAGTAQTLQGKEPLNVRFGYAKGAQLTYNGTPIDLVPHTKGSIARLQLGQ